jgi:Flp pilus assembly pilin Flp
MLILMDRLVKNEDTATMVEYALMVALIGAALVTSLKTSIDNEFTLVSNTISVS